MIKNIVFQGDSITDSGRDREIKLPNAKLGNGFVQLASEELLRRRPELQIYNRGVNGNRIEDLYSRWRNDTLSLQPDLLTIFFGINDAFHDFLFSKCSKPPIGYAELFQLLIDWTHQDFPGLPIIVLEPFIDSNSEENRQVAPILSEYRQNIRQIAKQNQLIFIPLQEKFDQLLAQNEKIISLDGIHPLAPGHAVIASAWLNAAKPLLD